MSEDNEVYKIWFYFSIFLYIAGAVIVILIIISLINREEVSSFNPSDKNYIYQEGGYINGSRDSKLIVKDISNKSSNRKIIILDKPCLPEQGIKQVFSNGSIIPDAKVNCINKKLAIEVAEEVEVSTIQVGVL